MVGRHQRRIPGVILLPKLCLSALAFSVIGSALAQERPAAVTVELRYMPEPNAEHRYSVTATGPAKATFEDGTTLANAELQLSGDLIARIAEVKEETFVVSLGLENPRLDVSGIDVPVRDAGDARPTVELTPRGRVVSTDFAASLLESLNIRGLDAALLPAILSVLQLPEEPVAFGGSWESEFRPAGGDAELVVTAKSTLTAADERAVKITSDVDIAAPAMEFTVMDFPVQVAGGTVKVEGLAVDLDPLHGAPLRAEGMLKLSLRGTFQQMPLNITADLQVKAAAPEAAGEEEAEAAPDAAAEPAPE
ncbi:MAG: hypothetical protein ACE5JM_02545 [Armatimonadota bacterium]